MEQPQPHTFNVHDPNPHHVPNFRGGPSENTKWFVMLMIAILGFAAGPVVTLIQAPKKDDWKAQQDAITNLEKAIDHLKSAAEAHLQVEEERAKLHSLEYSSLKEAIDNVKKHAH